MICKWRLPGGHYTTDVLKYGRAWHVVASPIEKATGLKLNGFDPELSFTDYRNTSIQLPPHVAVKLSSALTGARRRRAIPVYTATISHRHGVDTVTARSDDELTRLIFTYVSDWWDGELPAIKHPAWARIKTVKQMERYIDLYFDNMPDETLDRSVSTLK